MLWFPRTRCAFLQKALGRLCSCLEHAHEESVIATNVVIGLLLLPFHPIQIEKGEKKKASLKQIPINPAVQVVIM